MSLRVSTVEFRVRYAETDQMGVAYHAHYLVWCEIGRTHHIRGGGMSYRDMEARGVTLAVADASLRYRAPARYDDLIRVATTLSDVASRSVTFDYTVSNAESDQVLATARTVLISLDAAQRVVTLPRDLRALLAAGALASA
ncbi:MAG TPA: thioesterase family protein [Gemmatimonadaceae bacterium]|jgi:acyl-CoA thioester hydrolase|nr:thioesterase family protein [Gemmatimonadaceae bacterium]